mgnify:CR=1 FL=1
MIRVALIAACLLMAGCATAPKAEHEAHMLPVVEPVRTARTVYVPVETTRDDLRECLAAKRAEAVKKSKWREYAERLERLLGIDAKDDGK